MPLHIDTIKNGVAVEIKDFDITTASEDDINLVKTTLHENLIVVIKNQNTLPYNFTRFIEKIGKVANYQQMLFSKEGDFYFAEKAVQTDKWKLSTEEYPVQRVTGKKNSKNMITGIFGTGKLDWHANLNGLDRADGVALQGFENCENTSTSFLNTNLAYIDLDETFKKEIENVHCEYTYAPEVWAEGLPEAQLKMMKKGEGVYKMWLKQKNIAGVEGLYFYTNNRCKVITDDTTLYERLHNHLFQDKYIYQHWWQPGDIVLMDQLLTLHKRDQNDPDILSKRVLHRITFKISNYNNYIQENNQIA